MQPEAVPPPVLAGARRILVVRLDNLGDIVLTSPFARALAYAVPGAELTLLASPGGAAASTLVPWYTRTIPLRAVWQDLGGRMPFDAAREQAVIDDLAAGGWDAAFVLTSFSQSPYPAAYACYLAGIPVRVGHAPDFGGSVLSHPIEPPPDGTHQAERSLHLLEGLGLPVADRDLEIAVPAADRAWAIGALAAAGLADAPFVAVVPGASCAARRWPAARYGAVAASLARSGIRIVVLGSERERGLADTIAHACPSAVSYVGRTTIGTLAAVLEQSAGVLCGNSLALHLADALDRPVVAVYSGTDRESEWGPRRTAARLLRVPTSCAPCRRFDCPYALACLDLEPAAVAQAVRDLLEAPTRETACVAFAS